MSGAPWLGSEMVQASTAAKQKSSTAAPSSAAPKRSARKSQAPATQIKGAGVAGSKRSARKSTGKSTGKSQAPTARAPRRKLPSDSDEDDAPQHVRSPPPRANPRPARQRFRPLEYWRGERVIYGQGGDKEPFERIVDVLVAED